jgi:hypothetical protein
MNDHYISIQEESDYDIFHPSTERLQKHGANEKPRVAIDGVVTCNLTANQSVQILSLTSAMAAYNNNRNNCRDVKSTVRIALELALE